MKSLHFDSLDSTNTYLKDNYQNLDDLTFVSCDYQTEGKGRNGRQWLSEDSQNLLFSVLIKDKFLIEEFKKLSVVSAYSIIQILENYGLKNLSLKWPNDVYANDCKICGILLEAITRNEIDCLVIGIGLNVNQTEFNDEYRIRPTSMKIELNKDTDKVNLKRNIYEKLVSNFETVKNGHDFYSEITKYDYLKNKDATTTINRNEEKIRIIGINRDCSLKIRFKNEDLDIEAGEITLNL